MKIYISEDDEIFLMRAYLLIIYDEGHHMSGLVIVINDVNEEEKMEQERREFVSNVSHELRTPLTTMRSYLEALTEGAWKDKVIAPKFLSVTRQETERMIRLVNDLLQLSRMDSKEFSLHRKRTDFVGFFHQIIDRFEMHKAEDLKFERHFPKGKLHVWMDEDKMTRSEERRVGKG